MSRRKQNDTMVIGVMGATGSGKSTFINLASGAGFGVGDGLRSCTSSVDISPAFNLFGRHVTLIDTPGFDDTTMYDTDILKMIAVYLSTTYENGITLSGVIYLHRISDFRMTGISRRNFNMFRKLCGDESLKNVVIVTNMWGEVTPERGAAREHELATDDILFKPVLDKGAQMLRHDNTLRSAQAILSHFIRNKPQALQIQRELVDDGMNIEETAAAEELDRQLIELAKKHSAELAQVRLDMDAALAAKDTETREELEQVRQELEGNMARIQQDRERLSEEYAEEKQRADAQMREIMASLEAEKAARAERQREIQRLQITLEQSTQASAAEQQNLRNQLQRLQAQPRRRRGFFGRIGDFLDGVF